MHACKLLRVWFHRAGVTPLSIRLRCSDRRDAFPPNVLSAIAEFSQRLESLEMELPRGELASIGHIPGPFPFLRTLALRLTDYSNRDPLDIKQLLVYQDAPALRELHLIHWSDLTVLKLAFPSLTTLEVGDLMSIEEWSATRQRFPNLKHFKASLKWQHAPLTNLQNLPPLESLIMSPWTWGIMDPLPAVTLPHLRRLRHKLDVPTDVPSFLSFVMRSSCVLEHLFLSIDSLDYDSLMKCLLAVPSLVTLQLRRQGRETKLYQDLQSPGVLPSLRELRIYESACNYTYIPIIDMLRARRDAHPKCARLPSFELYLNVRDLDNTDEMPLPNDNIARHLQRLADDDLRIRILGGWVFWPVDGPCDTIDSFYSYQPGESTQ
ncbi:hypothetical protein C8R43DRAFT_1124606 [Mycena crocata]|nr:hypothetical protein C8R43DRAFT_1124606 [Mycena crocata]